MERVSINGRVEANVLVRRAETGDKGAYKSIVNRVKQEECLYLVQWLIDEADAGSEKAYRTILDLARSRDYLSVNQWLIKRADAGDVEAYKLILKLVELRDCQYFAQWLVKRADAGDERACNAILDLVRQRRYSVPFRWIMRMADAGNEEAFKFVRFQAQRKGDHKAIQWMIRRADAGDPKAIENILSLARTLERPEFIQWVIDKADAGNHAAYRTILGIVRDRRHPVIDQWVIDRADAGDDEACKVILRLVEYNRDLVSSYWVIKKADGGNKEAREVVLKLAHRGDWKAVQWMIERADAGEEDAIHSTFDCAREIDAALDWVEEKARNGNDRAKKYLDRKKEEDLSRLFHDMANRAERGNKEAIDWLSEKAYLGDEVAFKWLKKMADRGCSDSSRTIGIIYATGVAGVPVSYDLAREYLHRTKSNDQEVIFYLALADLTLAWEDDESVNRICILANREFDKALKWIADNLDSYRLFDSIVRYYKFRTGDTDVADVLARRIARGNPDAMDILHKAAMSERGEVPYTIGRFYQSGTYVKKSDEMATMWYLKAGTSESFCRLAEMAEESGSSMHTVCKYYYHAASAGSNQALYRLESYPFPEAAYFAGLAYGRRGEREKAKQMMESASRRGYGPATSWINRDTVKSDPPNPGPYGDVYW